MGYNYLVSLVSYMQMLDQEGSVSDKHASLLSYPEKVLQHRLLNKGGFEEQ